MKCPHCAVGIHEGFTQANFITEPQLSSADGQLLAQGGHWIYYHLRCPECFESVIYLDRYRAGRGMLGRFMAYPKGYIRPVAAEVPDPYRSDFLEASKVLSDSPKASAALSRRCLQSILRDKA